MVVTQINRVCQEFRHPEWSRVLKDDLQGIEWKKVSEPFCV